MNERQRKGQELAVAMLDAAQECGPASYLDLLNAIGNITLGTFCTTPVCLEHRLKEFDSWAAHTRQQIAQQS